MRVVLNVEPNLVTLTTALGVLVGANEVILRSRTLPSILDGSVRYRPEPPGSEEWRTVDEVVRSGYGDCEDLAAALAAELRVRRRIPARAIVRRANVGRGYHAVVWSRGRELDPSRWLGM
jgi:Transglutaminase-like superfamily